MTFQDTAEYKAFKACTSKLVSTIAGDLRIAEILLEKGLISDETYDYVALTQPITDRTKASKLVSSIRNKIKADKRSFNVFCDILEENNIYYDQLLKKLKEKQDEAVAVVNIKHKYSASVKLVIGFLIMIVVLLLARFCYHPPERPRFLEEYYMQLNEIDFDQYLPQQITSNRIPFVLPSMRLADEIQEKIDVTEMLDSIRSGTRLAVIGRPGVGKSTLAHYIVKMWARRSALQRFNTLFHICLGRANSTITGLQSLLEVECHGLVTTEDSELEIHQLIEGIKAREGGGVIFVLDGFDEYLPGKPVERNNYILRLIRNSSLPKSAIIITSRPRRVDEVKNYLTQTVEVVGFNEEDIENSLLQLGVPLRRVIKDYFDKNPNVKRICYLPLHMTMVIYLASLEEDALSDIDSETKIYKNFLYLTINQYKDRHGFTSSDLDDCFNHQPANSQLCSLFTEVCELAFNATIYRQQTFSSKELRNDVISFNRLEKLSLFQIKKQNRRQDSVEVFSFSHQTFRDFMSACHLAMLPESKQHQMIYKYGRVSFLRDLVWKFFFGLVGEKTSDHEQLCNLFRTSVSSSGYRQLDSQYYVVDLYPLAYAFETGKRNETFADLLDYANITGFGNNHSLHIHLREPMEMKSFLNIDESGRINFLFMKYALKWTPVAEIKIELPVQTIQPDPKLCAEYQGVIFDQSIGSTAFQEAFKFYCGMSESVKTDIIVLEVEYWRKQKHFDPQLIFSTLWSAIFPNRRLALNLKSQLLNI